MSLDINAPSFAQMDVEHKAWQEVVRVTKEHGFVKEADWQTAHGAEPKTPGTELITAIQKWGDELAKLRVMQDQERITQVSSN